MNQSPARPEADTPPVDSSARIKHPPTHANFSPPGAGVTPTTEHPPGAGLLPDLPGIKWEWKEQGTVVEAWHCPTGERNRRNSTYLGRIGKRLLASDQFQTHLAFAEWVEQKKAEKGIG